jgi:hypothetical protein
MMFAFAFPSGYDLTSGRSKICDPGRENPQSQRRTSAPTDGAFLVPVSYGGCAWAGFGLAGFLCGRFLTPRTVASQSREKDGGDSTHKGVSPMKHACIASASRARAHRKMAFAALRSDSSAAVRLKRYNHHMIKARRLEAQEVCS